MTGMWENGDGNDFNNSVVITTLKYDLIVTICLWGEFYVAVDEECKERS